MEYVYNKKEKIRAPIFWFAVFMSLMLFQTSYMRLGTITAFVAIALTLLTAFISVIMRTRDFRVKPNSIILTTFLLITFLVTLIYGALPSYFVRYTAQIILCIVLMTIPSLNKKEIQFLKNVFIVASVVYAVLIIISCYRLADERYTHDSIVLFNAELDPNFVGIPLVAASVFVLDNILNKRKRILNLIFYGILALSIIYTASRGNTISLLFADGLVFLLYLHKSKISLRVKIFSIILLAVAAGLAVKYFSAIFPEQWARMFSFGEGSDNGRFELWHRAFKAWLSAPIFGNGLGAMIDDYGKATHNMYLQLLSETGFVGSVLFVSFLIGILKRAFRFDRVYFCMMLGCLFQIAFLDALDDRCLWVILCWMALLPKNREALE